MEKTHFAKMMYEITECILALHLNELLTLFESKETNVNFDHSENNGSQVLKKFILVLKKLFFLSLISVRGISCKN